MNTSNMFARPLRILNRELGLDFGDYQTSNLRIKDLTPINEPKPFKIVAEPSDTIIYEADTRDEAMDAIYRIREAYRKGDALIALK